MRGATRTMAFNCYSGFISTHTPLARCDGCFFIGGVKPIKFQLTHLLRGATARYLCHKDNPEISTHTPLARCDKIRSFSFIIYAEFQLTHLLRGATYFFSGYWLLFVFQLTHLLRGATKRMGDKVGGYNDFNSHTSCEVRLR